MSLLGTQDRVKATVSKLVMLQRSSDCTSSVYCIWITYLLGDGIRTDRAVLAVNGFAADGKMFVKSVKQRLEVPHILLYLSVLFAKCINLVVSTCSREGHASSRDRTTDTNNVVRKEILPLLCL